MEIHETFLNQVGSIFMGSNSWGSQIEIARLAQFFEIARKVMFFLRSNMLAVFSH
jgi:hypothetical protein